MGDRLIVPSLTLRPLMPGARIIRFESSLQGRLLEAKAVLQIIRRIGTEGIGRMFR